jgi:hypothetical protein
LITTQAVAVTAADFLARLVTHGVEAVLFDVSTSIHSNLIVWLVNEKPQKASLAST